MSPKLRNLWGEIGFFEKIFCISYISFNFTPRKELALNKTQYKKTRTFYLFTEKNEDFCQPAGDVNFFDRFEKSLNSLKSGFK